MYHNVKRTQMLMTNRRYCNQNRGPSCLTWTPRRRRRTSSRRLCHFYIRGIVLQCRERLTPTGTLARTFNHSNMCSATLKALEDVKILEKPYVRHDFWNHYRNRICASCSKTMISRKVTTLAVPILEGSLRWDDAEFSASVEDDRCLITDEL